jgi:hypothetical protein
MSFKKYLFEGMFDSYNDATMGKLEKTVDGILKDCIPFLKHGTELLRGIQTKDSTFGKKTVRKDRKSVDSNTEQTLLYNLILDDLKLPKRNEVLFATMNYDTAFGYAVPYAIFPIGNFKFYWFRKLEDLFRDSESFQMYLYKGDLEKSKNIEDFIATITDYDVLDKVRAFHEKAVDTIETKSLPPGKSWKHEIAISTKAYYYLPAKQDLQKMMIHVPGLKDNKELIKKLKEIYQIKRPI